MEELSRNKDVEVVNYFEELNRINVNEKTDKKGKFTYLSWAFAWGELKKLYPNASYEVERFEDNKPYLLDDDLGYMVFTKVTVNDITHEMWLPIMNFQNKAVQKGQASMMDINKAIMRCLTKNIGMHGIGLYLYAGEDLPEQEDGTKEVVTATDEQVELVEELFDKERIAAMVKFYKVKKIKDIAKAELHEVIVKQQQINKKEKARVVTDAEKAFNEAGTHEPKK